MEVGCNEGAAIRVGSEPYDCAREDTDERSQATQWLAIAPRKLEISRRRGGQKHGTRRGPRRFCEPPFGPAWPKKLASAGASCAGAGRFRVRPAERGALRPVSPASRDLVVFRRYVTTAVSIGLRGTCGGSRGHILLTVEELIDACRSLALVNVTEL